MEFSQTPSAAEALSSQSPHGMRRNGDPTNGFRCCCGRPSCAFLERNNATLEGLEKDLRSAAHIGQALLERHESFMAEAEKERLAMTSCISRLELDKKELEASNTSTIEENRNLLDQLESINNSVSESDAHIKSLTETLEATRQELQRLTIRAERTAQLEAQLSTTEVEHNTLQAQLATCEEDNRSAMQRWRRAERTIEELQDQMDRMEREAKEEHERHVEVVARIERRRTVDKELESAAGRLKGTAAASTLGKHGNGSNVVSCFVKDILQDNANLQMGIVELREMLMNSNTEVESLREQVQLHHDGESFEKATTLKAELYTQSPLETIPEVHVHHHYHGPDISVHRKPKKKRAVIAPGQFSPLSHPSTPRPYRNRDIRTQTPSSIATILSHTSVSIPSPQSETPSYRWSTQSSQSEFSFAPSSVPSSPQSVYRASSVFDSIDNAFDSSRPTTPGSSRPSSPIAYHRNRPKGHKQPSRQTSMPMLAPLKSPATQSLSSQDVIPIPTSKHLISSQDLYLHHTDPSSNPSSYSNPPPDLTSPLFFPDPPVLRRAASHESLLSISGMDISTHTLHPHPSQLFAPATPLSSTSSSAVLSPTFATGHPTVRQRDYNRSLLYEHMRNGRRGSSGSKDGSGSERGKSLGQKVGGWVRGGWGVAPGSQMSTTDSRSMTKEGVREEKITWGNVRPAGVNQKGPVKGFLKPKRAPLVVSAVDEALLAETLGEETVAM